MLCADYRVGCSCGDSDRGQPVGQIWSQGVVAAPCNCIHPSVGYYYYFQMLICCIIKWIYICLRGRILIRVVLISNNCFSGVQSSYFSVQPDEGLLLRLLHHQDGDSHGRRGQHALPLAGLRGRQGAAVAASGSLRRVLRRLPRRLRRRHGGGPLPRCPVDVPGMSVRSAYGVIKLVSLCRWCGSCLILGWCTGVCLPSGGRRGDGGGGGVHEGVRQGDRRRGVAAPRHRRRRELLFPSSLRSFL